MADPIWRLKCKKLLLSDELCIRGFSGLLKVKPDGTIRWRWDIICSLYQSKNSKWIWRATDLESSGTPLLVHDLKNSFIYGIPKIFVTLNSSTNEFIKFSSSRSIDRFISDKHYRDLRLYKMHDKDLCMASVVRKSVCSIYTATHRSPRVLLCTRRFSWRFVAIQSAALRDVRHWL